MDSNNTTSEEWRSVCSAACTVLSFWPHATLLVKDGGLGIRCASELAPSVFLASSNTTSEGWRSGNQMCQ